MSSYLDELFAHQEWADAEHWGAFESHSPALDDRAIRERLFHIHMVQHAFLYMTGPRTSQFVLGKIEDFSSAAELKRYGKQGLADLNSLLKAATAERLDQLVEIPWFKPPATISVRQALTQAAMHSHYHRGQNATRLRELGGIPPMTDFIAWLHKGKPAAQWE